MKLRHACIALYLGFGAVGCGSQPAPGAPFDAGPAVRCLAAQSICNGVCVDERNDPNNCGRCGETCSFACANSTCQTPIAISAGESFSCAALSSGGIACWGYNAHGELGDGPSSTGLLANSSVPVAVADAGGAAEIASNGGHSCAVTGASGAVQCWGESLNGEVGGGYETISSPLVPVASISAASAVALGSTFSCALIRGGAVQCWGYNADGELGNGSSAGSLSPVIVSGLSGATAIAAGTSHACALAGDAGTVQCWGENTYGALGNGTISNSTAPVTVMGVSGAVALAAGNGYSCAVLSSGSVSCWGYNGEGELGDGTFNNSLSPVMVQGVTNATAITANTQHTCALLASGAIACWGENAHGQLGNGTAATPGNPTPSLVRGVSGATAVAAGDQHTCALFADAGTVECWGWNFAGQLGNRTTTDSYEPVGVVP